MKDGSPLMGAAISIPDLKTGAYSDVNGNYEITNLPKGKFMVQVKYLGYETIFKEVALSGATPQDFTLVTEVVEQNEIVITGTSKATELKRSPVPIVAINKKQMDMT